MPACLQDFDSPGLKNKKHWNSFTSDFFLDASWVLAQLRQVRRWDVQRCPAPPGLWWPRPRSCLPRCPAQLQLPSSQSCLPSPRCCPQAGALRYSLHAKEALLKQDLRCHRCGAAQANMPQLKAHIASCTAPLPQH